jgi:nicotinamide mononucleotide adenylyltransferase
MANPKFQKATKYGYLNAGLHLAPASMAGYGNICPWASAGCKAACLNTAGNPVYLKGKIRARLKRTALFFENRKEFYAQLKKELAAFERKAKRLNLKPAFRLNATSDIFWPEWIYKEFPGIQFYHYTKNPNAARLASIMARNSNVTYVYSRHESTDKRIIDAMINHGINVAVVFKGDLPTSWRGYKVINGDESDLVFLYEKGVIIGLEAKGKARKDESGFAVAA